MPKLTKTEKHTITVLSKSRANKLLQQVAAARERLDACHRGCHGSGRITGEVCDCVAMFPDEIIKEVLRGRR